MWPNSHHHATILLSETGNTSSQPGKERGLMQYPLDLNEMLRLSALERLEVAKRIPDATVDRITAFAREHFRVPICLVTVVESECVLMISKQGLETDQAPRNVAFC